MKPYSVEYADNAAPGDFERGCIQIKSCLLFAALPFVALTLSLSACASKERSREMLTDVRKAVGFARIPNIE